MPENQDDDGATPVDSREFESETLGSEFELESESRLCDLDLNMLERRENL